MRTPFLYLSSGRLKHGVFQMRDAELLLTLKEFAVENDYAYSELNGLEINDKAQFLSAIELALASPIKLNWDTFESELKSVSWIPKNGIIIVYRDFQAFQRSDITEFRTLLSIVHFVIQLKTYQMRLDSQSLYFVFYSDGQVQLPLTEIATPHLVNA
ncbi:MAG: hypothetical protein OHK0046_15810 [Anaerolineae bacterium]